MNTKRAIIEASDTAQLAIVELERVIQRAEWLKAELVAEQRTPDTLSISSFNSCCSDAVRHLWTLNATIKTIGYVEKS